MLTCCWRCATPTCQPARLPLLPVQLQPHHALAHVPPPARPRLDDEDAAKFRNMPVPVRFQLRQGLKVTWQKSADRGSDACCPQRRWATSTGWSCPTTVLVPLGGEEPHQRWRASQGESYYDGSRSKDNTQNLSPRSSAVGSCRRQASSCCARSGQAGKLYCGVRQPVLIHFSAG